jgi:ferritin
MHEQLREGFQAQMQAEFESAYLYLAMASYCAHQGWMGCAHWLRIQWQEELEHALKFFEFLLDRGVQPELRALQQPAHAFGTPLELFTKVLEHEQYITGRIHRLYRQAIELEDYPRRSSCSGSSTSNWRRSLRRAQLWSNCARSGKARWGYTCWTASWHGAKPKRTDLGSLCPRR